MIKKQTARKPEPLTREKMATHPQALAALIIFSLLFTAASSCSSAQLKESRKKRDQIVAKTGTYCQFVELESSKEIDVELNLIMAEKCDFERSVSLIPLTTATDTKGVLFCCSKKPEPTQTSTTKNETESTEQTSTPKNAPSQKPSPSPSPSPK